jgi:hypothetical protein
LKERWKPIEGYEGLYEVSDTGKVRSLERVVKRGNGFLNIPSKEKEPVEVHGYLYFSLFKEGKERRYAAHRLVAQHFIENPDNKPQINHLNGNKKDNRVQNLEWATQSENNYHALRTGLRKQYNRRGDKNPMYGKHHSESAKKKIALVHSGTRHTEETRKRMSASHKGRLFSDEHKMNLSESMKGKNLGKVFINNGQKMKCVANEELESFFALGWKRGKLKK